MLLGGKMPLQHCGSSLDSCQTKQWNLQWKQHPPYETTMSLATAWIPIYKYAFTGLAEAQPNCLRQPRFAPQTPYEGIIHLLIREGKRGEPPTLPWAASGTVFLHAGPILNEQEESRKMAALSAAQGNTRVWAANCQAPPLWPLGCFPCLYHPLKQHFSNSQEFEKCSNSRQGQGNIEKLQSWSISRLLLWNWKWVMIAILQCLEMRASNRCQQGRVQKSPSLPDNSQRSIWVLT